MRIPPPPKERKENRNKIDCERGGCKKGIQLFDDFIIIIIIIVSKED